MAAVQHTLVQRTRGHGSNTKLSHSHKGSQEKSALTANTVHMLPYERDESPAECGSCARASPGVCQMARLARFIQGLNASDYVGLLGSIGSISNGPLRPTLLD